MPDSVMKDRYGPDWPLGLIVVAAAGTPVGIMSLVDPTGLNAPNAGTGAVVAAEYSPNVKQLMFQGFKDAASGLQINTGNIYVMRVPNVGMGDKDDHGATVMVVGPGQTMFIGVSAAGDTSAFSPYRYLLDADNNGDSALVTAFF